MTDVTPEYVSLEHLASKLRLPKTYLRSLAQAGTIPTLRAGRRMRFRIDQVARTLHDLAEQKDSR